MAHDNILSETIAAVPIVLAVIDRELAIEERKLAELQRAATRGGRRFPFGAGAADPPTTEEPVTATTPADGSPLEEPLPNLPPMERDGSWRTAPRPAPTTPPPSTPVPTPTSLAARFGLVEGPITPEDGAPPSSLPDPVDASAPPLSPVPDTFDASLPEVALPEVPLPEAPLPDPAPRDLAGSDAERALAAGLAHYETELPYAVQEAARFEADDPDALPRALVAAHEAGRLPPEVAAVVAELRVEEERFQAAEAWLELPEERV